MEEICKNCWCMSTCPELNNCDTEDDYALYLLKVEHCQEQKEKG